MPTLQADPNDLAAMGIPVADWPFYQVGNPTGPSAPVPEESAAQLDGIISSLLDIGIPISMAIPLAVEIFTSEGGVPGTPPQATSVAEAIASNPPTPTEAGGMGGPPGSEPSGFGPVGEGVRGTMRGIGLANVAANLAGLSVPGLNTVLGLYSLGIGIPSAIAAKLGVPSEPNPFAGVPSLAEVQAGYDYGGFFAGEAAAAARAEAEAAQNTAAAEDLTGYVNAVSPADRVGNPAGWEGNPYGAPAPSVTNPDAVDFGGFNDTTGMGDVGGGLAGGGAPGESGGGRGGPGGESELASGGVFHLKSPRRFVAGEAGREDVFFVPEELYRRGLQPNEEAIKKAMATSLLRLILSEGDIRTHAWRG